MELSFGFGIDLEIEDDWRTVTTALQRTYGARETGFVAQADGSPLPVDTRRAQVETKLAELALAVGDPQSVLADGYSVFDLSPVRLQGEDDWEAVLRTWLTVQHGANGAPETQHVITYRIQKKRLDCKVTLIAYLFAEHVVTYLGELLARVIRDYPEAGETLRWTPYFDEGDIPPWLQSSYDKLLAWLRSKGGQYADWTAVHWLYKAEVEALQSDAGETTTAPASELASDAARDGAAAKYPNSLDIDREMELYKLWADNSLTKSDIANKMGIGVDRLDQYKDKYQLPDRRRGRKSRKLPT